MEMQIVSIASSKPRSLATFGGKSNMNTLNSIGRTEIEQARSISKSLGFSVAAKYLKVRGWSIEATLWFLCKREAV